MLLTTCYLLLTHLDQLFQINAAGLVLLRSYKLALLEKGRGVGLELGIGIGIEIGLGLGLGLGLG